MGLVVGDGGLILKTIDLGQSWTQQASGTTQSLVRIRFVGDAVLALGQGGVILATRDDGQTWQSETSGTDQNLTGVTGGDVIVGSDGTILELGPSGRWSPVRSGTNLLLNDVAVSPSGTFVVGEGGTILQRRSDPSTWEQLASFGYRYFPAPWFYLAILFLTPFLIWSATPTIVVNRTSIEEIVASDSPIDSLKEDKLGQHNLVEKLSRFLQNSNTSPPLVISLQGRGGMGKSSVMRMLESDLRDNRAAVTVWFNAWHHQKEDQLLAYLLEAIQKQAVPPWLSPIGLSFRFDLLRVRLFAEIDRLGITILSIAFLSLITLWPDLFSTWQKWVLNIAYVGAVLAALQVMIAFKSNPEKLADKAGGLLVDTLKELLRLPSLIGKSDVRQEFANNLKDVVEALKPQRLVIFLDDLDRCRADQVVQILEAINFLSSVAPCVIIIGADYEKVETLVAMQFETIALREAENKGTEATADAVNLRVGYARNYLKKIVNLRLNLRLPTSQDYRKLLSNRPIDQW